MAAAAKLYYFEGRGRAEQIRWLLAATGVAFTNEVLSNQEEFNTVAAERCLFAQVPLLVLDGRELVQTQAILRHLARRGGMAGVSEEERTAADTAAEGVADFRAAVLSLPFSGNTEACQRTIERYAPVFEKLLGGLLGTGYVAGGAEMTYADVLLAEACFSYGELFGQSFLRTNGFEKLATLVDSVVQLPGVAAYLRSELRYPFPAPGSAVGDAYVKAVRTCLA